MRDQRWYLLMLSFQEASISLWDQNLMSGLQPLFSLTRKFSSYATQKMKKPLFAWLRVNTAQPLKGIIQGGLEAWTKHNLPIDVLIGIEGDEFLMDYKHEKELTLLDLREGDAFLEDRIEGAISFPVEDINEIMPPADTEDNTYLYSNDVFHTTLTASFFRKFGYYSMKCVLDPSESLFKLEFPKVGMKYKKTPGK